MNFPFFATLMKERICLSLNGGFLPLAVFLVDPSACGNALRMSEWSSLESLSIKGNLWPWTAFPFFALVSVLLVSCRATVISSGAKHTEGLSFHLGSSLSLLLDMISSYWMDIFNGSNNFLFLEVSILQILWSVPQNR